MNPRRKFIAGSSLALIATTIASDSRAHGLASDDAALLNLGFVNRFVAISRGVYSEPRFSSRSKVRGTVITLTTGTPGGKEDYKVTVFGQFSRDGDEFKDAPAAPTYHDTYAHKSFVRDAYTVNSEQFPAIVSLFVPDEVFFLREGNVEIRFDIRFMTLDNLVIPGTGATLPPETVAVSIRQRKRVIAYNRNVKQPPTEIFDLLNGTVRDLER